MNYFFFFSYIFISLFYKGDWGIPQNKCKSNTFAQLASAFLGIDRFMTVVFKVLVYDHVNIKY